MRAVAAQPSVHVSVRESTGASCALCLEIIAPGTRQYELDVGRSTVVVHERCYKSSLEGIVELRHDTE